MCTYIASNVASLTQFPYTHSLSLSLYTLTLSYSSSSPTRILSLKHINVCTYSYDCIPTYYRHSSIMHFLCDFVGKRPDIFLCPFKLRQDISAEKEETGGVFACCSQCKCPPRYTSAFIVSIIYITNFM